MSVASGLRVGAVVAALTVIVTSSSALAGDACPAGTLGVSRILEVDTTGGPWYGEPNGDPNFLAPGEVVLTFDDGPSPKDTREVLAALAKECTKATFFIVGERVALHPEIVKELAEQGHTIGTHTWSHPNLARLSLPDVTREIEATFDAAQKASPEPVAPFFRHPYPSSSKVTVDYLKSRNIERFRLLRVSCRARPMVLLESGHLLKADVGKICSRRQHWAISGLTLQGAGRQEQQHCHPTKPHERLNDQCDDPYPSP